MTIKDLANFGLNMDSPTMRAVRRLLIIFVLAGLAEVIKNVLSGMPAITDPTGEATRAILIAVLAMIDKIARDYTAVKTEVLGKIYGK